jgi:hypothetical protein
MPKLTVLKSRDGWVAKLVKVTLVKVLCCHGASLCQRTIVQLTRVGLAMHVCYDTTLQLLVMSSCIHDVREPAGACFLFSCFIANSLQLYICRLYD